MKPTFIEFLAEAAAPATSKGDMKHLVETIKRDCQQFLREMSNTDLSEHRLYRGMRSSDVYRTIKVRKNRQPVDTQQLIHDSTNDWFESKFGIKARSETVFASTGTKLASRYGTVYSIFPIGEHTTIWSPTVMDLYISTNHLTPSEVIEFLEDSEYQIGGISLATRGKSNRELMIKCDSYYAIRNDVMSDIFYFLGNDVLAIG